MATKRLNVFERYLSVWVGLCMVAGVAIGHAVPALTGALRSLEFGQGSQINVPIAVLIWLMIYPMMLKIDFASIARVGQKPDALGTQLVVHVRIVDDLAGEDHRAIREASTSLVRIVHGAVDAVAEPEFSGQPNFETTGLEAVVRLFQTFDEVAVIARGQHAGDLVLEVEAFAKDKRRHRFIIPPTGGGGR